MATIEAIAHYTWKTDVWICDWCGMRAPYGWHWHDKVCSGAQPDQLELFAC